MKKIILITLAMGISACATTSEYQHGCRDGVKVATDAVNSQLTNATLKINQDGVNKVCADLEARYEKENLDRAHLQAHNIGH